MIEYVGPPPLIRITVEGDPVPKARARVVAGHTYTPATTVRWEEQIRAAIRAAYPTLEPDAVHALLVRLQFHLSTFRRRDIDNLAKAVLDAMNGIVWKDDVQVTDLLISLERGSERSGVSIAVSVGADLNPLRCPVCDAPIGRHTGRKFCSRACSAKGRIRTTPPRRCMSCKRPMAADDARLSCSSLCERALAEGRELGRCQFCSRPTARRDITCCRECYSARA